jgi:hypothetical protein
MAGVHNPMQRLGVPPSFLKMVNIMILKNVFNG